MRLPGIGFLQSMPTPCGFQIWGPALTRPSLQDQTCVHTAPAGWLDWDSLLGCTAKAGSRDGRAGAGSAAGSLVASRSQRRANLLPRGFLTQTTTLLFSLQKWSQGRSDTNVFSFHADSAGDLWRLAEPHGACHSSQAEHCREGTQHHCAGQGPRGAAGLAQGADGRRRPLFQAGAETDPGAGGERRGQSPTCSPGGCSEGAWRVGGRVQDRPFPAGCGTGRLQQHGSQVRAATAGARDACWDAATGGSLATGSRAAERRPFAHPARVTHPCTHKHTL